MATRIYPAKQLWTLLTVCLWALTAVHSFAPLKQEKTTSSILQVATTSSFRSMSPSPADIAMDQIADVLASSKEGGGAVGQQISEVLQGGGGGASSTPQPNRFQPTRMAPSTARPAPTRAMTNSRKWNPSTRKGFLSDAWAALEKMNMAKPKPKPTTSQRIHNTQTQYFANRIEEARQRALLANLHAHTQPESAQRAAGISSSYTTRSGRPTTVDPAVRQRQQYFAKRIEESRQRALLANIQASKQYQPQSNSQKNAWSPKRPLFRRSSSSSPPPQAPVSAQVAARQQYFANRIAESRRLALMDGISNSRREPYPTTIMASLQQRIGARGTFDSEDRTARGYRVSPTTKASPPTDRFFPTTRVPPTRQRDLEMSYWEDINRSPSPPRTYSSPDYYYPTENNRVAVVNRQNYFMQRIAQARERAFTKSTTPV